MEDSHSRRTTGVFDATSASSPSDKRTEASFPSPGAVAPTLEAKFGKYERQLISLDGKDVEVLRTTDRARLMSWVYHTAWNHFAWNSDVCPKLAEELAHEFFLEFCRKLPDLETVVGWTRARLRDYATQYFIRMKMRIRKFISLEGLQVDKPDSTAILEMRRVEILYEVQCIQQQLENAPDLVREALEHRLREEPGPTYREIAAAHTKDEEEIGALVSRIKYLVSVFKKQVGEKCFD